MQYWYAAVAAASAAAAAAALAACGLQHSHIGRKCILSVVGYDGVEPDHAPFVVLHKSHQTKIETSTIVNKLEDSIIHTGCSSLIIMIIDALALRSRWTKDNGLVII